MRKLFRAVAVAIVGTFLVLQVLPYGRDHDNPPVLAEPSWDSPETRAMVVNACFDCHSNETVWPWYSLIAPVSWIIQGDVSAGREELNFSEWDAESEGDEIAEAVIDGDMPPATYALLNPKARLSEEEIAKLVSGLELTFGSQGDEGAELGEGDEGGEGDELDTDD